MEIFKRKRRFVEMLVIVALLLFSALVIPQLKGILSLLAVLYIVFEVSFRKETKKEEITSLKRLGGDLKKSWFLILLVSVVLQLVYFFIYKNVFPEVLVHVQDRVEILKEFNFQLVLTLLILALGEELVFRGLIQERFQWYINPIVAILITSFIFALLHVSQGSPLIVAIDLTTVFIDSILFGFIYYKTRNVYASWVAHALGNIIAAVLIFTL